MVCPALHASKDQHLPCSSYSQGIILQCEEQLRCHHDHSCDHDHPQPMKEGDLAPLLSLALLHCQRTHQFRGRVSVGHSDWDSQQREVKHFPGVSALHQPSPAQHEHEVHHQLLWAQVDHSILPGQAGLHPLLVHLYGKHRHVLKLQLAQKSCKKVKVFTTCEPDTAYLLTRSTCITPSTASRLGNKFEHSVEWEVHKANLHHLQGRAVQVRHLFPEDSHHTVPDCNLDPPAYIPLWSTPQQSQQSSTGSSSPSSSGSSSSLKVLKVMLTGPVSTDSAKLLPTGLMSPLAK